MVRPAAWIATGEAAPNGDQVVAAGVSNDRCIGRVWALILAVMDMQNRRADLGKLNAKRGISKLGVSAAPCPCLRRRMDAASDGVAQVERKPL